MTNESERVVHETVVHELGRNRLVVRVLERVVDGTRHATIASEQIERGAWRTLGEVRPHARLTRALAFQILIAAETVAAGARPSRRNE